MPHRHCREERHKQRKVEIGDSAGTAAYDDRADRHDSRTLMSEPLHVNLRDRLGWRHTYTADPSPKSPRDCETRDSEEHIACAHSSWQLGASGARQPVHGVQAFIRLEDLLSSTRERERERECLSSFFPQCSYFIQYSHTSQVIPVGAPALSPPVLDTQMKKQPFSGGFRLPAF